MRGAGMATAADGSGGRDTGRVRSRDRTIPAMEIFTLHRGTAPLLVSLPHDGTLVPDDIAARLTPQAWASSLTVNSC